MNKKEREERNEGRKKKRKERNRRMRDKKIEERGGEKEVKQ